MEFVLFDLLRQAQQNSGAAAHRSTGPNMRPPGAPNQAPIGVGHLYRGGLEPRQWIQREQQSQAFLGQGGANVDVQSSRERGNAAVRRGEWREALAHYTHAIEHNETEKELSYSNRSFVYFRLGNFASAASDARQVVNLRPDYFKGHYRLAKALMGLNRYDDALPALRRALSLAETDTDKQDIEKELAKCESKRARQHQVHQQAVSERATNSASATGLPGTPIAGLNYSAGAFATSGAMPATPTSPVAGGQFPLPAATPPTTPGVAVAGLNTTATTMGDSTTTGALSAEEILSRADLTLPEGASLHQLLARSRARADDDAPSATCQSNTILPKLLTEKPEIATQRRSIARPTEAGTLSFATEAIDAVRSLFATAARGVPCDDDDQDATSTVDLVVGRRKRAREGLSAADVVSALPVGMKAEEHREKCRALVPLCDSQPIFRALDHYTAAQEKLRLAAHDTNREEFHRCLLERDDAMTKVDAAAGRAFFAARELLEVDQLHAEALRTAQAALRRRRVALGDATPSTSPGRDDDEDESLSNDLVESEAEHFKALQTQLATKLGPVQAATDEAAQHLRACLDREAAVSSECEALVRDLQTTSAKLVRWSKQILRNPPVVPAEHRKMIEDLEPTLRRAQEEKLHFTTGSDQGAFLLQQEAVLEKSRLECERRRIQLQAEVEWVQVRDADDSPTKVDAMKRQLASTRDSLASVLRAQREVQEKIIGLVHSYRPELAWRAAAGGQRRMKWIKGSGLWVSDALQDYRLIGMQRTTANSKVFQARSKAGDVVALKEIPIESDEFRRRFRNEVNILASQGARHPYIVPVKGVFFDGPCAYVVMPFFARGSLADLISGDLSSRVVLPSRQRTPDDAQGSGDNDGEDAMPPINGRASHETIRSAAAAATAAASQRGGLGGSENAPIPGSLEAIVAEAERQEEARARAGNNRDATASSARPEPRVVEIDDDEDAAAGEAPTRSDTAAPIAPDADGADEASAPPAAARADGEGAGEQQKAQGEECDCTMRQVTAAPTELPLPEWKLQELFRQLASSVLHLHQHGIVHADIKPSNVLVTDDLVPQLTDFGIARDIGRYGEASDATWTGRGQAVGTRDYMPPELLGLVDPDAAASVHHRIASSHTLPALGFRETCDGDAQPAGPPIPLPCLPPCPSDGSVATDGALVASPTAFSAPGTSTRAPRATMHGDVWSLGLTLYMVAATNTWFAAGDAQRPRPTVPVLQPGQDRISVSPAEVGGSEKLANLLEGMLTTVPQHRPTVQQVLSHPYFTVSMVQDLTDNHDLTTSNDRLEALFSFIHAARLGHNETIICSVMRNQMVESVGNIFAQIEGPTLLNPLFVVFQGEPGIDEGGLTSEMFVTYFTQAISKHKLLVSAATEQESDSGGGSVGPETTPVDFTAQYVPSTDPSIPPSMFMTLGKMLVKGLLDNRPAPMPLNHAVFKFLLNVDPNLSDLEEYDRTLASNLRKLMYLSPQDLEELDLTFEDATDDLRMKTIQVTAKNVREYIETKVKYILVERRRPALEALRAGFYACDLLRPHLQLLNPTELFLVLCGQQHISAESLIRSVEFSGFPSSSEVPTWTQELIRGFSQNNLRRFLRLCTASISVPSAGLAQKIKIVCTSDTDRLPVGHTCAQQLDLPNYASKETLAKKLGVALAHTGDGFHIL